MSATRARVIPGLYDSGEEPSMESRNLFALNQVRYLVKKRTTYLRLRHSLGKMR